MGMGIFGAVFGIPAEPAPTSAIPVLSNVTPTPFIDPGDPGAFNVDFSISRLTPITFDVSNITIGSVVTITVQFADRNENYVVLDTDGEFRWPFDVPSDNTIAVGDPAHVHLLPRGGWPPTVIRIRVATSTGTA